MYSETICDFVLSVISILNILGEFSNVVTWLTLDLILYLCVPFLVLLMSRISFIYSSGITWGSGTDLSAFIFPNIILGNISIFGVTVKSWLLIG